MAKIMAKEYKDVKRILNKCLRAEGEYPRKDKRGRVPPPQDGGSDLTAAHWAADKFTGLPRPEVLRAARQHTVLQDAGE